jgi:hypothetical protein
MRRRRLRARLLVGLTGLFPAWWQQRYRAEFTEMLEALLDHGRRDTLSLMLDIVVGALDAHLWPGAMTSPRRTAFPVVRRAVYDGLIVAAVVALDIVVTNLIPAISDDGENLWGQIGVLVVYAGVIVFLTVTGARGSRRSTTRYAGGKAGAAAGFVIVTVAMLTFFAVDNLFLGVISRQPQKVVAFATSGESSMRTFINLNLATAALLMIPVVTVLGALLGSVGGLWSAGHRPFPLPDRKTGPRPS